jgi:plastocyanin
MNLGLFGLRRAAAIGLTTLLAFALVACSSGDESPSTAASEAPAGSQAAGGDSGSGTATVTDGAVTITAADLAFDATTIEAPAGEAFTITLVNNDSAPHNISIYTEEGGEAIVQGEVINQGETVEVEVPAQEAGEYYFHCDVHPDMNGTLVVG